MIASNLVIFVTFILWVLYMYYVKHQLMVGTAATREIPD